MTNGEKIHKAKQVTMKLRTIDDLNKAHEWLWDKQRTGKIDAKTADALNTTLKGAVYLNGKLKMDAAKLILQAQIKKITIPANLLPTVGGPA